MAEVRFQKDQYRHNKSRIRDSQVDLSKTDVAERIVARAADLGLKQTDISTAIGIPKTTMGRIWKGDNLPDSGALFPLSDILQVSPRWLLYGGEPQSFADAPDSDWLTLPVYDFAGIGSAGKGRPIDAMQMRREWLSRKLRTTDDLWLTEMPNDLLDDIGTEGDSIVCRDIGARESEFSDGRVYIVALNDQPIIRRVSFEADAILLSTSSGRLPAIRVPRSGLSALDDGIVPVARVFGALILTAV